jgi:tryptophanyl-tRNA synthetase
MHVGHLVGALENWVRLQDSHDCFFVIVDWHALTTDYQDTSRVNENVMELAIDWLAAGLDPERLHLLLSMIVPVPWLERVPTYKEQQDQVTDRDLTTYGFLGYPLLQTADILLYRATAVPVGEDQLPHLELSREIARRFNGMYGDTFPEPKSMITRLPRLPGTDGRKMSKMYGNAVNLGDDLDITRKSIMTMVTDPARKRRNDPGNPDVCPVYDFHKAFSSGETLKTVDVECRRAGIGCVDCKKMLLGHLEPVLSPLQDRRRQIAGDRRRVREMLDAGAVKAGAVAGETMEKVRSAMKIDRGSLA